MLLVVLCCGTLYPILFDHELDEEESFGTETIFWY